MKECPMCGENMRLEERQYNDQLPGQGELSVRMVREWNCPECDYFEEAEAGEE
jgi:C4-type Zn-finger protein